MPVRDRSELRSFYTNQGWVVQEVGDWGPPTSAVGVGAARVFFYDVQVVSPDNEFFTAQVVVRNQGTKDEDAKAIGRITNPPANDFEDALSTFLRAQETGSVYAIARIATYEEDEVAIVLVWTDGVGATVDEKRYVVKRRADTFTFKEIVAGS